MRCLKCGHLLSTSDIYCSHCGLKVQESRTDRLIAYYKAQICFAYDKFEKVSAFAYRNENYTFIKAHSKNGWELFDLNGRKVISETYSDIVPYFEIDGESYYFVKRGKKWALRTTNKYITQYTFDNIYGRRNLPEYCFVKNNGKEGIIKTGTGEIIFDCIFDSISPVDSEYSEHILFAELNGKYGIINIAQKSYLTSFQYNNECAASEAYREKCKANMDPLQKRVFEIINNPKPRLSQKQIKKSHEFMRDSMRKNRSLYLNFIIQKFGKDSVQYQQFMLDNLDLMFSEIEKKLKK